MNAEKPIELRKVGFRQSRDGDVISFALHPDEDTEHLSLPKVGTRFGAVIVQLADDDRPVEKRKPHPLVQRAGILCNDPQFQAFILSGWPLDWGATDGSFVERAAHVLRMVCGIQSRKELVANHEAAAAFEDLYDRFEKWKRGE